MSLILPQIWSPYVAAAPGFDFGSISGLVQEYDFSDTSTLTLSGSDVTDVADKSSAGNDITQATSAKRMQSGVDTINGLNVLTALTGDYMEQTGQTFHTSGVAFWTGKLVTLNGSTVAAGIYAYDGAVDFQAQQGNTSNFYPDINSSSHGTLIQSGSGDRTGEVIIWVYEWDASANTGTSWVNGTDVKQVTNYTTDYSTTQKFLLGTNRAETLEPAETHHAHFLRYNSALSIADKNTVGQALADKWGVTWTDIT